MEERQKKFIESVLSRRTPENSPLLETVMRAYVLNEGLMDRFKDISGKLAGKTREVAGKTAVKAREVAGKAAEKAKKLTELPPEPAPEQKKSPVDYASLRRAVIFEKDCWDRDLQKFYMNCEMVKYYLSSYGIRDFNEIVRSDSFKKAVEAGRQIDAMRPNPLLKDDQRRANMHEALQLLNWGDDRALMEGIMLDFDESENVVVDIHPMLESRGEVIGTFKECMAGIANFIRRHGYYPWAKFLQDNRFLLARAHKFDQQEYPKKEEPVNMRMAADIASAFHSGHGTEDYDATES